MIQEADLGFVLCFLHVIWSELFSTSYEFQQNRVY